MKVTIAKFKYDKGDGSVPTKQRKVLVLSKPSDSFFGIEYDDISEVENVLEYLREKEAFEDYLKHKYGLADANYKRFKEAKIRMLTEEKITV